MKVTPKKNLFNKICKFMELKLRRATSYEVVKYRLYSGLYSPDLLKDRMDYYNKK